MFYKEVYRGLARYIGEDELYDKIDGLPPFQFYKNEIYEIRIIDEGYLFYVFVLTLEGGAVTYVPYKPGNLWTFWEAPVVAESSPAPPVAAEPSPAHPTFVRYWIDRLRSKFSRRNRIVNLFLRMGELPR